MESQSSNETDSPLATFALRIIELGESAIQWWVNNADFSDTEASLKAQTRPSQPQNDNPNPLNE